ncbi:MAG: TIGR04283 family arsenosugar biosynthesis glycosyltransferase [Oscillospiraceae bacterium]
MKLSIIIPTFNEKDKIDSLLLQLSKLQGDFEVLFGDGGSCDGTVEKIQKKYAVIMSPKGRAKQMNMAALHSTGEVLLFLHCDCRLPDDAIMQIQKAVDEGFKFGCFKIKFDSNKFLMKCCGFFSNIRVRLRRIAFGDQGIFITKKLFNEIGGFPDLPIMEDYRLSIMLKRRCPLCQINSAITASARKFEKEGILHTMWKMQKLQYAFRHGGDIYRIAGLYGGRG